jgi:hypothetical protein
MIRDMIRRWLGIDDRPRALEAKSLQDLVIEEIEEAEARVEAKTLQMRQEFDDKKRDLERRERALQATLDSWKIQVEEREGNIKRMEGLLKRHNLDITEVFPLDTYLGSEIVPLDLGSQVFATIHGQPAHLARAFKYKQATFERTVPLKEHSVAYIVQLRGKLRGRRPDHPARYPADQAALARMMDAEEERLMRPIYVGADESDEWGERQGQVLWANTFDEVPEAIFNRVRPLLLNLARMGVLLRPDSPIAEDEAERRLWDSALQKGLLDPCPLDI